MGYSPRGHKESDMTEVTWHACNPCMAGFTSEWASLIAQLVKNPPIMQETPVQFLGQEYPLEKGKATHSSTLAWRIPYSTYSPWGCKESTLLIDFHVTSHSSPSVQGLE